jgi:hypothetical protein
VPVLSIGSRSHHQQGDLGADLLALLRLRRDLEPDAPGLVRETAMTGGAIIVLAVAACATAAALLALTLMVLAHTPQKTVAEIIRDAEAR